jgi:cyclophilin family peptidyl-prolyl cis-trans isomerase
MILPFQKILSPCLLALILSLAATQQAGLTQQADPIVVMETTKGTMAIRVYVNMVPNTARNFLDLVSRGFYDGKTFHRVETWCIQGGDPNGNGTGNFVDPASGEARYIPLEINRNLRHSAPGVVAMARSQNPNSASCQFYIVKRAMTQLDGQYAIFGGVVKGLNTIYGIRPGDRIIHAEIVNQQGGEGAATSTPSSSQSTPTSGAPAGTPATPSGF